MTTARDEPPAGLPAGSPAGPLRVVVVDDEPLARAHLRALLEERGDVEVVGECGDGRRAVEAIRTLRPDLVLLDIQMPELDGLGVVREVGVERMPPVVFVTAYDEHALAAFDHHALGYLLKPVDRERFARAIDRVVAMHETPGAARAAEEDADALASLLRSLRAEREALDRIAVKLDGRVRLVRAAEIDWIEAAGDQVRLHVGPQVVEHRATLTHLEQRLSPTAFLRIHRSTLVNVDRIREIQPWFQGDWIVLLADGTRLQTGKSYRARVREFIERRT